MTLAPPRPLIEGPSAWIGAELARHPETWIYQLSPAEIAEIEAAVAKVRGRDLASAQARRFRAADARAGARRLREEVLERPRLCADPRPAGRRQADRGLRRCLLGDRHALRQPALAERDGPSSRPCPRSRRRDDRPQCAHLPDHRAAAFPHRLVRHRRPACASRPRGGRAVVDRQLDGDVQQDGAKPARSVARLFLPFSTDRRGEVPVGEKPYFDMPVYNDYQGHLSAIYSGTYIRSGQRFPDARRLTAEDDEALEMFDDLANDKELRLDMELRPGDMQFLHNHTCLHDRTAFIDWPEPEQKAPSVAAVACRAGGAAAARRCSPRATARPRSATAAASSARRRGCTRRWSRCNSKFAHPGEGRGQGRAEAGLPDLTKVGAS